MQEQEAGEGPIRWGFLGPAPRPCPPQHRQMLTSRTSVGVQARPGCSSAALGSRPCWAWRRLDSSRASICSWQARRQSCGERGGFSEGALGGVGVSHRNPGPTKEAHR